MDVPINDADMAGPPLQKQSPEEMDFDGWAEVFAGGRVAADALEREEITVLLVHPAS